MNTNFNSFEVIAYFTERLMYSLNRYASQEKQYNDENGAPIFGGISLPYSDILPYERAKGKIILLSEFTESYPNKHYAQIYADRNKSKSLFKYRRKFSVIFIIKNNIKKNWISNGIKIGKISVYNEREILYQPFSFYFVKEVMIDLENYTADIYLETIGKKEILEEKIKLGKEIKYNEKEKIIEIK